MTQKQIRIFLAVAATGSFSGAAEALSISEPAVSRSIKSLEEEFNCELFERKKGRRLMMLSDKGNIFFEIAQKWQYLIDDALELSEKKYNTLLHLSAVPTIAQTFLPQICHKITVSNPGVHLSIASYTSRQAAELISKNQLDLAFTPLSMPAQTISSVPLFREESRLVCARRGESSAPLDLTLLNPEKQLFIVWDTDDFVWEHFNYGSAGGAGFESRTNDGMGYYLREMNMWSVVPVSYAAYLRDREGLAVHSILGDAPRRTIYALRHAHNSNPLIDECIGLMREMARCQEGIELLD
ncbi:MAG: LysR family transcriptional regulator [Lachnospiraceae bacterium]|nr:LysR family transcriptional regulator [Lachnospiraceae bacterium]